MRGVVGDLVCVSGSAPFVGVIEGLIILQSRASAVGGVKKKILGLKQGRRTLVNNYFGIVNIIRSGGSGCGSNKAIIFPVVWGKKKTQPGGGGERGRGGGRPPCPRPKEPPRRYQRRPRLRLRPNGHCPAVLCHWDKNHCQSLPLRPVLRDYHCLSRPQ